MIAHLRERAAVLMTNSRSRRETEWLALVCLHGGVFFRSQYLAFLGRDNPALAHRLIRRCGDAVVEETWNGSRLRLCRIVSRPVHRALGAEHLRHWLPAAPEVVLRRLLALDFVLDRPHSRWLEPDVAVAGGHRTPDTGH